MNTELPPADQCDVYDKPSLIAFREKEALWWRWLRTDDHHAMWPQIYSMLLGGLTFRAIAAAADADTESALHSPIMMRGLLQGYAALLGLLIRRLVDKRSDVISIRRLLKDIGENRHLLTRENYVSGSGTPYGHDSAVQAIAQDGHTAMFLASGADPMTFATVQANAAFDDLAGTQPNSRSRTDIVSSQVIGAIEAWLAAPEIGEVVKWSNKLIAHSADQAVERVSLAVLAPSIERVSTAQRLLVRATESISAYLLSGPIQGIIIPVLQYKQFAYFDVAFRDPAAAKVARQRWRDLSDERNNWTRGLRDELTLAAHVSDAEQNYSSTAT